MKKRYFFVIGIIIFCAFIMSTATWAKSSKQGRNALDKIVETQYGRVIGYVDENNVLVWKSIPYAKPPVGNLRWQAPQDPDPWMGVKSTKKDCEPCSQMGVDPVSWAPIEPIGSEDCLYLNVYRPRGIAKGSPLPVYVWIHGGSNNYGSIQEYDGSNIADRGNMVVVTIQYRLGPFGWLAHESLRDGEDDLNASGNFGTLDTFKALEWIQENIAAFGGDPDNVLVTGESAGAHNTLNCVVSPLTTGLFHKAMAESGGMFTVTMEKGETRAEGLINGLMALDGTSSYPSDVEAYLRDKDTYDLIAGYWHPLSGAPGSDSFRDGVVLPEGGVVAAIESGNYNKVPIILGSNQDEMKFFAPLYPVPTSTGKTFTDLLSVLFPDSDGNFLPIAEVLSTDTDRQLYKACTEFGSLNWRYNFVDRIARPLTAQQDNVYAYHFRWDGIEGSDYNTILGAAHATEIAFFHGGSSDLYGGIAFNEMMDTPGRKALSEAMMDYLANFAHTGDPNGGDLPMWTEWSNAEEEDNVIVFDADADLPIIEMIDEEITPADVGATFGGLYISLPEDVRDFMYWFYWY